MSTAELYLQVREKEGRLYPDDMVARLPDVPGDDPLHGEWRARAVSLAELKRHIDRLPRPLCALELGCGNGWLTHHLAALPGLRIWGLDVYSRELKQAARLFTNGKTGFLAADIFRAPFGKGAIDVIVVASAIQYFPDLPVLIRTLREVLAPRGELHILDSPLYEAQDVAAARERTRAYYAGLGFPEMAEHYFHHTFSELQSFSTDWLHKPDSMKARVAKLSERPVSPFPWLCIRNEAR